MPTMQLGALLEPGLRSEASQVYRPRYDGIKATIGEVIWMEGTSDKFQEVFGFLEAPLYFTHWPAETPPPSGVISSQRYVIYNRDFARRVYLPRNSEDDQTGTAMQFARMIAQTYAILPEQIFYQVMTNTSYNGGTAPMPVIPNAADGNALYLTTTRYGSSGGNVVTVTGTSTVAQIITDISSVKRRFIEFQNTQSQPFWDPTIISTMSIFYGSSLTLVMDQARAQSRVGTVLGTDAGTTPTNLLKEAGYDVRWINSQRISNTSYYCWLRNLPNELRPVWRQVRKGYTEWQGNFVTSDHSRDTGQVYVQGDCREGWGSVLAMGTIRVS